MATYLDDDGIERHVHSGRKVRKDKGTRKPHPPNCRHCEMVNEYKWARDAAVRAKEVACGDEDSYVPIFKDWLTNYWRRVTIEREYEYASAA